MDHQSGSSNAKIIRFSSARSRPTSLAASPGERAPLYRIGSRGLTLWTDSLDEKHLFDLRYTCDLDNSSPELRWKGAPEGTQSFVLLMEDLDTAEPFTHWLVYMIPRSVDHLPAGIPPQERLPNGIRQGLNSYRKLGYAGPCPPLGHPQHRYRFTLYALDTELRLPSKTNRDALLPALEGHVLDQAEITGFYMRTPQARAAG